MLAIVKETDSLGRGPSRLRSGGEFSQLQAILPVQFYGRRRQAQRNEPLLRLMAAVLLDAVRCLLTRRGTREWSDPQEFVEARSWIFSDEDDGVFSFKGVCETLAIDPGGVRKALVRRQEKGPPLKKMRMVMLEPRRSPRYPKCKQPECKTGQQRRIRPWLDGFGHDGASPALTSRGYRIGDFVEDVARAF